MTKHDGFRKRSTDPALIRSGPRLLSTRHKYPAPPQCVTFHCNFFPTSLLTSGSERGRNVPRLALGSFLSGGDCMKWLCLVGFVAGGLGFYPPPFCFWVAGAQSGEHGACL